jgi:hypothetical protein
MPEPRTGRQRAPRVGGPSRVCFGHLPSTPGHRLRCVGPVRATNFDLATSVDQTDERKTMGLLTRCIDRAGPV